MSDWNIGFGGGGDSPFLNDSEEFEDLVEDEEAITELANAPLGVGALVASKPAMDVAAASNTAMGEVAASQTVMEAVIFSDAAISAVVSVDSADATYHNSAFYGDALAAVGADGAAGVGDVDSVAASQTAMDSVVTSTKAMDAVSTSETAMDAVSTSEPAMDAVSTSQTAMDAVSASQTAMDAVMSSLLGRSEFISSDHVLSPLYDSNGAVKSFWQNHEDGQTGETMGSLPYDISTPHGDGTISLDDDKPSSVNADSIHIDFGGDNFNSNEKYVKNTYDLSNADELRIQVRDPSGNEVVLWVDDNVEFQFEPSGWVEETVDVSGHSGEIEIAVGTNNDSNGGVVLYNGMRLV